MPRRLLISTLLGVLLLAALATAAWAVSGAAFTTFNAHVDGAGKDVCKNSAINCNIYGAKEYVWLNGGPTANGLGPNGQYFFAVLEPGGQPNPNDGGAKNLSDDYDAYTNRTFTVTNGEVSAYGGTHWFDSGKKEGNPDLKPNGLPPYIRLFPYADTSNPGGVYILAVCSLEGGYPVSPRDCKYDAFKVQKGKVDYSFYLSGMKFEDRYADGAKNAGDGGLQGWKILITGTAPDGSAINTQVFTDANGFWEYFSPVYTFTGKAQPGNVSLQVCEELQNGWFQSYPGGNGCHAVNFAPTGYDSFFDLDFGNYRPVEVTACKEQARGFGLPNVPVAGWEVSLTKEGVVQDTQYTGDNGCYTWTGLTPGFSYDVHEAERDGWVALLGTDYVFAASEAYSGASLSHTFVNAELQGCTPGFWQGGNDFGTAGGKWLWNEANDSDWAAKGGMGTNPYIWTTPFNSFFTSYAGLDGFTMMDLVGTGGGPDDFQKAGRSLVAAYLNASYGIFYKYNTGQLHDMWNAAVANGTFLALHTLLDAANNAGTCPISASMN